MVGEAPNRNRALPLTTRRVRSIAVIGVDVTHVAGTDPLSPAALIPGPPPVPSSFLAPPGGTPGQGLQGQYWSNTTFTGDPAATRPTRPTSRS